MLTPLLLPAVAFAVERWGLRGVQRWMLAHVPAGRDVPATASTALEAARRSAWVVEAAARRGPWPANCLQRSLVLWWVLRRRGLGADLLIGVRRRPGSHALDFHAWVEHGGIVLNDVSDVRGRFATFERPIAPPGAAWR